MEDESVDLTVTSPPYDDIRKYNGFSFDFESTARELYRVTKNGGVVVWVVADQTINGSESGTSFKQALYFMSLGFNLHDTMIYEKNSMSMPDTVRYYQKFEYMFVFSKGKPKTVNLLADRKNTAERWSTEYSIYTKDGKQKKTRDKEASEYGIRFNIWKYNTGFGFTSKGDIDHPAMFPLDLAKDHILSWSKKGDTVLDPFMGSGTTGVACKETDRQYIGFEISKEYCDAANKRIDLAHYQYTLF